MDVLVFCGYIKNYKIVYNENRGKEIWGKENKIIEIIEIVW